MPGSGQGEARSARFARWFKESHTWQGDDYVWINRFRDLYEALAAAVGVSDSPDADLTAQTEDEPVKSTSSVSASATERPDARAEVDGPSGLREQLAAARAAERIEFGMRQKAEDECGRLQEQLADVASQSEFFRQRALAAEAQTGELREQLDAARQALQAYHNLAPALAECANDCGTALLYSDLKQANDVARAVLGVEGAEEKPSGSAPTKTVGRAGEGS